MALLSYDAGMRGADDHTHGMCSYVSPEQRVPAILRDLSPQFAKLYSDIGRPSIPPEQLLRALLLQVLYSVRSERLLVEQLQDNLLFRWFIGPSRDAPVWSATTFTKNRDRLLRGDIASAFFRCGRPAGAHRRPALRRALHRRRTAFTWRW